MPRFETVEDLSAPLSRVFDFFSRPANLPKLSPPELHMQLVSGPEQLHLGAFLTLQGRRWGLSQRVVSEVTIWEPEQRFIDEQREGPFKKWIHSHQFEALPDGGTRVMDRIDYEPPGGILQFILTPAAIVRDLKWVFDYRREKLIHLFDGSFPG